jgi:hypothetical protein
MTFSGCRTTARLELYDVLVPGPKVKVLAINADGSVVVSREFVLWVEDLKTEILRLRHK